MEEDNIENFQEQDSEDVISESDLLDVYDTQYNDLFPKILKIDEENFFRLLQEQVLITLRIINKVSDLALISYFQDFLSDRYRTDKKKITTDIEKIKKLPENELIYLDYSNCYIHCHKNLNCFHNCSNKLIYYEGFIYCLHCNKVYNEHQIKLYCNECDEIYFSKIRKNVVESNELFPVIFSKPHCEVEFNEDEIIKCLECGEELYYDLSKVKDEKYKYKRQKDGIKQIICPNCKLIYDTTEIKFNCIECNEEFMSDAKLYNDFSIYKKKILYLVHTLRKGKLAFPENFNGKNCKCDINSLKEFYHNYDDGVLLEGHKDEKNKIMCDRCFEVLEKDNVNWKCPICGEEFKSDNLLDKNKINRSRSRSNKYIKNEVKIENKLDLKEENNNEFKEENKLEENEIKNNNYNSKKELNYQNYNNYNNYKYNPLNSNLNVESNFPEYIEKVEKADNYKRTIDNNHRNNDIMIHKNQNNIINNKNKINIYHINKYNNQINDFNYNNQNNKRKNNNIEYKYDYKKLNINYKIEDNNNKENKENYNYNSSRATMYDSINNYNNINSNRANNGNQKRKNYISNRNKNSKFNIRHNHQIININETSKYAGQKRNSAIIDQSKKEIKKVDNKDNKENKEKDSKKNLDFKNIQKYFDDFNEEYEREFENKKKLKEKNKNEKEAALNNINSKNNIENKNHLRHHKSNIHNIGNNHNGYNVSNKGINNSKNKNENYNYYDSNNNIKKFKRQFYNSRENIREKKNFKKNLSGNKYIKRNESSKRQNNIKLNNYNYENKDYNNYNNRQKQNIPTNIDKNNRNDQQPKIIYKKNDYNKKENEENQENEQIIEQENNNEQKEQIVLNINNYRNLSILGQGSYGKIYLVEDIRTKEQFAMKKLILDDKLDLKDNQDEYNMIMQLTDSFPELNIIQIYGTETKNFDDYNFVFYVLMEVANCDWEKELLNRAKHKAFYSEEEIVYILQSLVDTFSYLQQIGICHRDIKPQNILCFGDKGYKISDFGEAKYRKKWRIQQSTVEYTSIQTVRGTELYMSPILYMALKTAPNKGANHNVFKSDVFSLGMCFLFASCLDYKSLYEVRQVNNMNKISEIVDKYVNKKYSQNFVDILLSMLQVNEKERPDFIELSTMI